MGTDVIQHNPRAVSAAMVANMPRPGDWDERQVDVIRRSIAPKANDAELALFAQVCHQADLDPFKKEIYLVPYGGKHTVVIGIDGFRKMAKLDASYIGQEGPFWCGPDGQWRDVWLEDRPPAACKVGIQLTKGGKISTTWQTITYKEFAKHGAGSDNWKERPAHMLAVRAEAHALKRACADIGSLERAAQQAGMGFEVLDTGEMVDLASGEITGAQPPRIAPPVQEPPANLDWFDRLTEAVGTDGVTMGDFEAATGGTPFDRQPLREWLQKNEKKPIDVLKAARDIAAAREREWDESTPEADAPDGAIDGESSEIQPSMLAD